jgi:hypothetical protein
MTRRELAWSITISPGPGSDLAIAFLQSRTAASASRPHDASSARELPAVEGVRVTSLGRQGRCRTRRTLVGAEATDISILPMIRQSIAVRK